MRLFVCGYAAQDTRAYIDTHKHARAHTHTKPTVRKSEGTLADMQAGDAGRPPRIPAAGASKPPVGNADEVAVRRERRRQFERELEERWQADVSVPLLRC